MGRIMAVDYGLKRVGLAVTDPLKIISSPMTTVDEPEILTFLKEYFSKEEVDEIVVGWPVDLLDRPTDSTPMVAKFIEKLIVAFPDKKVSKWDERFTSKIAKDSILEGGAKKQKRRDKKLIDKVSASLILQSYMESL